MLLASVLTDIRRDSGHELVSTTFMCVCVASFYNAFYKGHAPGDDYSYTLCLDCQSTLFPSFLKLLCAEQTSAGRQTLCDVSPEPPDEPP